MPPSLWLKLGEDEQTLLLDIARRSIHAGLASGKALLLDAAQFDEKLRFEAAVFTTLTRFGELRGCVGSLQPTQPLTQAVANSAFNAAFQDRRFGEVQIAEVDELCIEVSVLSEMVPVAVTSRQALLELLQPGVDGLLLEDRGCRSTFLPKVWDKISAPNEFLSQLMLKAGLPAGHWSSTIRCHRYHTLTFAEK